MQTHKLLRQIQPDSSVQGEQNLNVMPLLEPQEASSQGNNQEKNLQENLLSDLTSEAQNTLSGLRDA